MIAGEVQRLGLDDQKVRTLLVRLGAMGLFDLNQVKKYHPPHLSPRITVQQSVFTIHPNPTEAFQHPTLERWVLDQKACWPIKRNLNAGGVSYSSLFERGRCAPRG